MTEEKRRSCCSFWKGLSTVVGITAGIKAAWIIFSHTAIEHNAHLSGVVDAPKQFYVSEVAGGINYYSDSRGTQRPILLIHGIHPAAGSHDMAAIFNSYRTVRPIYLMDLPGFGASEKGGRSYRPSLYSKAITDFIQDVVKQPVEVVAMGLSCEFAAAAAVEYPELIHSLTFINPTGFNLPHTGYFFDRPGMSSLKNLAYSIMAVPLWSVAVFDLLVNRPAIVNYYRQRFTYQLPEELVDVAYTSSHQSGAHFAPLLHLAGKLSTKDVRNKLYHLIQQPVLVLHDQEPGLRFDMLPFTLREHGNWQAKRIRQTRGMPHIERKGEMFHEVDEFWRNNNS
ncbi:MAG: alpha/beta fold hydrolase [Anaerolineaceae bacterium]